MIRKLISALVFSGLATAATAQACVEYDYDRMGPSDLDNLIVSYFTGIDQFDHYNSRGVRLLDARQVIQQDRANVHKFGKTGPEDSYDSYFTSVNRRSQISTADLVTYCHQLRGPIINSVVNGDTIVKVIFYRSYDGRLKLLLVTGG